MSDPSAGAPPDDASPGGAGGPDDPLLAVEGLERHYPVREGFLRRRVGAVRAVDGVDFAVGRGETLGLVGESGCGKSTAAASVLGLEEPTGGSVRFDGREVTDLSGEALARFRRRTAMVFQDPNDSLDPRMTVGESAGEPLAVHGVGRERRRAAVADLFDRVGLARETLDRYPHELSGGQKQRVGLARALSLDPEFVVLDEPVSALDVSVQAEILALLADLGREFDLSVLLVSHDVSVVRAACDRVAVMYAGQLVERGATEAVLGAPQHPYTEALAAAVPTPDPRVDRSGATLSGDVPDAADPPDGCRFHPRCPAVLAPDGTDLTSEEYRAVLDFRAALDAGAVDPERVRGRAGGATAAVEDGDASGDGGTAGGGSTLRGALRAEYGLPAELGDEAAEETVAAAVGEAAAGETAAARERLAGAFSSVCERDDPAFRPTDAGHPAACHRHDG
ncbi:ABC transporter ATP-binding protein [Candidatus Halobonum tyrrellensis]|uniref:Peptide ABC transporter ATPase n=1 Tax=Candidatus Halobonum tyrrellensis G22 TaxID=1324957 RepID=V4HMJ3_9EURY|nr:oligopeptide/dipeptide ABC transporter ATP-binding protein [Candidatus Halobonum tyrrellensis]ESP89149.1 peptide ABC transporter ATPase [Candidatus Halobonum tyrrellensis G22]